MRKILLFSLMMLLALSVTACEGDSPENHNPETGQTDGNDEGQGNGEGEDTPGENGRYLVLFASRSGNTERMAQTISSALDCDIVEVVPGIPYEDDYNSMLQRAQSEQAAIGQGNFPVINTKVDNLKEYDMIFIGYPIWYGHMATPMQTFLHNYAEELKGKQIALFASSGSSGIGTSVSDARTLVPDATFTQTLLLTSSSLGQMSTRIASWLEQIGAERANNENSPDNNSLIKMGHIDGSGIDALNVPGDVMVRFEQRAD